MVFVKYLCFSIGSVLIDIGVARNNDAMVSIEKVAENMRNADVTNRTEVYRISIAMSIHMNLTDMFVGKETLDNH